MLLWGLILQCFVLYQSLSLIKLEKIESSFSWKVITKDSFNRNNNNMTNMTIKITPIKIGRREEGALSICITYLIFCVYFYSNGWPGFFDKYYLDKKKPQTFKCCLGYQLDHININTFYYWFQPRYVLTLYKIW